MRLKFVSSAASVLLVVAATLAATAIVSVPGAYAAADLEITSMLVQGTPKTGSCNKVSMTVKNNGDAFTGDATLDITLITFPSGTPTQNRVSKDLFISPMQGGAQVSFNIEDVEFKAEGSATVQALVDSKQETSESNENNNDKAISATVSGSCYAPPPPPPPVTQTCDVEAVFTKPSESNNTVPSNSQDYSYEVRFKNIGSGSCEGFKVKLMRYNTTACSGYGSQVGGSRAWVAIDALQPGATDTASFSEKVTPPSGKACLKLDYSPFNYSDANNTNHRPKLAIAYQ